jgi:hypothetical protein
MDPIGDLKKYLDEVRDAEVLEWYRMTPEQRLEESSKLWDVFKLWGGRYDPGPDTQSPFHLLET